MIKKTNRKENMARKLSPAAEVAKLLKKKAKEMGLVATAKSHNYTGGDSVNVYITEGTDANLAKFKEYSGQYKYGHFDGMIDLYEYSNTRDDIPQTKYLFVQDDRAEKIIKDNLDQTQKRFYEHEFKLNDYDLTSWQWLNKFKEQLGEDWQKYLAKFLQDFSDPGINLLAKQYLGWDFQMIKKEAA
tara:strand:- start:587 stop:1144 length:558 start_codon:yes stop_codon:yes gene_type:complete